jgi:hypothetical protein
MGENRLVNAYAINTNDRSRFRGFEIGTMREVSDYYGGTIIEEIKTAEEFLNSDEQAVDEPFYRVFGVYRIPAPISRKALGDFYDYKQAVQFLEDLTGLNVHVYSY